MNRQASVVVDTPTGDFALDAWRARIGSLRRQEPEWTRIAEQHRLELLGNSRWPELRLRRRSAMIAHELRLALAEAPAPDGLPRWILRVVRYPRFPPLFRGRTTTEDIAELADADLAEDGSLSALVQRALPRLLADR